MNRRSFLLSAPALLLTTKAFGQTIVVTGAGATFPAPLYYAWANQAEKDIGVKVNYQSIGSGAGINQIRARTVDFGATDSPLEDPGDLYQFPIVEGRVVPIFNVPGIDTLNLTMPLIVKIYQGQITSWNDPQIVNINLGKNIPRIPIVPIYRADGSGTTFIWTKGMKDSNSGWNDVGTSVRWPTGQGARGNEGVAATVQRVRGAIGYVEFIYAKNNNIPFGVGFDHPVGKTYILLPKQPKNRATHDAAVKFFEWCMIKGLNTARSMHYYTLPHEDYDKIIRELKAL